MISIYELSTYSNIRFLSSKTLTLIPLQLDSRKWHCTVKLKRSVWRKSWRARNMDSDRYYIPGHKENFGRRREMFWIQGNDIASVRDEGRPQETPVQNFFPPLPTVLQHAMCPILKLGSTKSYKERRDCGNDHGFQTTTKEEPKRHPSPFPPAPGADQ